MIDEQVIKKYQWMRNAEAGQIFGNQMEIRTLTQEVFTRQVLPRLRPGIANKLEEYQLQFPEIRCYLVIRGDEDVDWRFVGAGSLKELKAEAFNSHWALEVFSFDEPIARDFGMTADIDYDNNMFDNDDPDHRSMLIDKLQVLGLSALEWQSGMGIQHVIIPLIDGEEISVDVKNTRLRRRISSLNIYNQHHPYLYIATNSLRTKCEIGLLGEYPNTKNQVDFADLRFAPDIERAVEIFAGFWETGEDWINMWSEGTI